MTQVYKFVDGNGETRLLAEITPDPAPLAPVSIMGSDPATVPLTVTAAPAQSNDLLDVITPNGGGLFVDPNGQTTLVPDPTTGGIPLVLQAIATTGDIVNWTTSLGALLGRITNGGYVILQLHAAPADVVLQAGDCSLWFDQTNGASKLMVKGKSANGTVVTGSVTLA